MENIPPQDQQAKKETLPGHWLMCIAGFLFPLYGVIFGVYAMQHKEPAWQRTGKCTLIAGVANTVMIVCLMLIIVGGFIRTAFVISKEVSLMGKPAKSPVQVRTINWSKPKSFHGDKYLAASASKGLLLCAKVVITNVDTVNTPIASGNFWLKCVDGLRLGSAMYGDMPLPTTLAPGGTATGSILFDLSTSMRPESVYYQAFPPSPELNRSHKKRGWFGR